MGGYRMNLLSVEELLKKAEQSMIDADWENDQVSREFHAQEVHKLRKMHEAGILFVPNF